jgi:RNA polymerase sigma factor (sigma-70 family)
LFKKISDKKIIENIKNQDDKTLEWLYNNYYQTIKNHIIKNSGTEEDVSDVFQDTIIILYSQITEETLNLTTDLKGYFFGVARNIWNVQLRKKKRIIGMDIDLADDITSDESNDLFFERIVSRAFLKIKPDCQAILNLYSEGLSFKEIAVRLTLKNEIYARRKKYLCKESLMEIIKKDPEYQEYLRFQTL